MRRRLVAVVALALLPLALPGNPAAGGGAPASLLDLAFSVEAEAYPTEPAPGSQDEAVAVRPNSSRVQLRNPPTDAYARAAQADLGLAEGFFGSQGANAEADTTSPETPEEVVVDEGGAHLEARVSTAPSGEALAEGSIGEPTGSGSSHATGELVDGALVATAEAEVKDFTIGPLLIGQGRFDALVVVDGTPGGAVAEGQITMSETSVNGVPVILDATGVRVDESQVPAPFVDEATAAIQESFSQGGFSDIRVVQPRESVSDDGMRAEVSGGGVLLHFTNNDPANRYFVTYTLLGGRAAIDIGAAFDVVGTPLIAEGPDDPAAPPPSAAPPVASGGSSSSSDGSSVVAGDDAGDEVALDPQLTFNDGTDVVELQRIWPYWPWVLLAAATLILGWALAWRDDRFRDRVQTFADSYLRG